MECWQVCFIILSSGLTLFGGINSIIYVAYKMSKYDDYLRVKRNLSDNQLKGLQLKYEHEQKLIGLS